MRNYKKYVAICLLLPGVVTALWICREFVKFLFFGDHFYYSIAHIYGYENVFLGASVLAGAILLLSLNKEQEQKAPVTLVNGKPFVLTNFYVVADELEYGKIYANNIKYLYFVAEVYGYVDADVMFQFKIFHPDGSMHNGNTSFDGFTTMHKLHVDQGKHHTARIGGWGKEEGGCYPVGINYRAEIWYGGEKLKEYYFCVH